MNLKTKGQWFWLMMTANRWSSGTLCRAGERVRGDRRRLARVLPDDHRSAGCLM